MWLSHVAFALESGKEAAAGGWRYSLLGVAWGRQRLPGGSPCRAEPGSVLHFESAVPVRAAALEGSADTVICGLCPSFVYVAKPFYFLYGVSACQ